MEVKGIIKGIVTALKNEFQKVKVYTESIEQGVIAPCFFVRPLTYSISRHFNNRYKTDLSIVIQYLAENETKTTSEMLEISRRLFFALEVIDTDDGIIRAMNLTNEDNSEGVFTFTINYKYYTRLINDDEHMNGYTYKGEVDEERK